MQLSAANPPPEAATFPPARRVLVGGDFERAFKTGQRISSRSFRIHWCATGQPARLGLAVSRKVSTRAVDRNRIKRVVRDSFRRTSATLPAGDVILVAYREALTTDPAAFRDELAKAWRRIAALPASHTQGTIRPAAAGSRQSLGPEPAHTSSPSAARPTAPGEPTLT